jgi:predicted acetyltransferase
LKRSGSPSFLLAATRISGFLVEETFKVIAGVTVDMDVTYDVLLNGNGIGGGIAKEIFGAKWSQREVLLTYDVHINGNGIGGGITKEIFGAKRAHRGVLMPLAGNYDIITGFKVKIETAVIIEAVREKPHAAEQFI